MFKLLKYLFIFLFPLFLFAKGIEDAETYHNNSELQKNIAVKIISLIPWKKSEKILDIGSGDGKITALISQKIPKGSVLGIDISQPMVHFASSYYKNDQYPNLSFVQQDITEANFENLFNRIVSFSTFHWILDQEKALKAIYKALLPKGTVCIQTYGKGKMNVTDICDFVINKENWKSYFPEYKKERVFLTKQEFYDLLKKTGFKKIKVSESINKTIFTNRQALLNFVKPLLTSIHHLSTQQQEDFIEEVVEEIISLTTLSKDGSIVYQIPSLQATGVK